MDIHKYVTMVENLNLKIIAISYKLSVGIKLTDDDVIQIGYIEKCAELYNGLNDGSVVDSIVVEESVVTANLPKLSDEEILTKDNNDDDFGFMDDYAFIDDKKDAFAFLDDYDFIDTEPVKPDNVSDPKKENNEKKEDKKEDKKEEISYETDPELMEICASNLIKFDEFTKRCNNELHSVQDSFWSTVDISPIL